MTDIQLSILNQEMIKDTLIDYQIAIQFQDEFMAEECLSALVMLIDSENMLKEPEEFYN